MLQLRIIICWLALCQAIYGQNITREYNATPITPEAAALAKMVNYPINHNTGIPNISIPLYEIKTGGMSLPIELVYHAGGFKINEQAGRVGLGWSLSCDLQITRTIYGKDDFESGGYLNNTRMKQSNRNYTYNDPYSYPMDLENQYYLAMGEYDGMPDKFYYKLLNKSGSFFFQKNTAGNSYTIVPVPYDNIKIEFNTGGSFVITDTDGTTYYFGYSGTIDVDNLAQYGIEASGDSPMHLKRTAWKCMRIDNPNCTESITFTYSKQDERKISTYQDKIEYWKTFFFGFPYGPYYADEAKFSGVTHYDQLLQRCPFYQLSSPKYKVCYGGDKIEFHLPYLNSSYQVIDKIYTMSENNPGKITTYIEGLNLTKITYRGGQVEFEGSTLLGTIKITDNQEVKRIQLFQSYIAPAYLTQAQTDNGYNFMGTNYLDSVRIGDDKYTLLYPEKYCFGNHLKRHDAWGYVNEQTYERAQSTPQALSLPRQRKSIKHRTANITKPFYVGGSNILVEQPNEQYMQKGILKRIGYPTGGFVDFDFEANKYEEAYHSQYTGKSTVLRNGGGLRIRSINYYTGDLFKGTSKNYIFFPHAFLYLLLKNSPNVVESLIFYILFIFNILTIC